MSTRAAVPVPRHRSMHPTKQLQHPPTLHIGLNPRHTFHLGSVHFFAHALTSKAAITVRVAFSPRRSARQAALQQQQNARTATRSSGTLCRAEGGPDQPEGTFVHAYCAPARLCCKHGWREVRVWFVTLSERKAHRTEACGRPAGSADDADDAPDAA